MQKRYRFVPANGGPNYKWSNDHSYVKVSSQDTGGSYTLIEDNLTAEFSLGLHLHRHHAETFYILSGTIPFYVDGDWMDANAGSTIHIPPGVVHAVAPSGAAAKMLMVMQPSGFDQYLAALDDCSEDDFANEQAMKALAEKHDIFEIGPVPERSER